MRNRAQNPHLTSRFRLGERLSPERETVRSTPILGRLGEPILNARPCISRLGEMDSLGRKLQKPPSDHTQKQPEYVHSQQQQNPIR